MARQEKQASPAENPSYLYIDEFHHFITGRRWHRFSPRRANIVWRLSSHIRNYRQLESRGSDVASAVLSNPYTRVCFRVGDQDARKLAEGFSFL